MMLWSPPLESEGRQVAISAPCRAALLSDLAERMQRTEGFSLATLNLDHVVKLRQNPDFRAAYLAQTHVTADGNPIVWLSRLAGQKIDLIPGSDLVDPVAALAAQRGVRVAMLGTTDEALAKAAEVLAHRHPGLNVVLQLAPPMGFDPDGSAADAAITAVAQSGAGLCYLALGAPKQEIFAARAHACLPHVGFLSIGAGLDFVAGTQRRAPRVVRRLAAEWLWRLAGDPARLARRYGACLAVLPGLTLAALRVRRDRRSTNF